MVMNKLEWEVKVSNVSVLSQKNSRMGCALISDLKQKSTSFVLILTEAPNEVSR